MKKLIVLMIALGLVLAGCDFFAPPETFTVSYDVNGGTGTAPADTADYEDGDSVTVKAATGLTKTEHSFAGWNTMADGSGTPYAAAATFDVSADTVLYAQWTDLLIGTWTNTLDLSGLGAPGYSATDALTINAGGYSISRTIHATSDTTKAAIAYALLHAGFGGAEAGLGIATTNPQVIESGTFTRTATADALWTGYTGYYNRTYSATTLPANTLTVQYQTKFSSDTNTLTVHDGGGTAEHGVVAYIRVLP